MINLNKWRGSDPSPNRERTLIHYLKTYRSGRTEIVDGIVHDLIDFAISEGRTNQQIGDNLELFFLTFDPEMMPYFQVGGDALATAINDDVTIPWLDTDAGGQTIRTRIVNRLS